MRMSVLTRQLALVAAASLLLTACADAQTARRGRSYAQTLLRDALRRHPKIKQAEIAAMSGNGCVTVAASDAGDIGDKCDGKERNVMQSGEPDIEDPSMVDPVYIISEALHDASGAVVGIIITDVMPERGRGRDAALARARALRRDIESRIQSAAQLTAGTPAASNVRPR
jgi:hypothetical protein